MPDQFRYQRRVEFCETDAAGIAHFSAFFCYMEQTEHAFWRSLGETVLQDLGDGWHLSWPRVHVECDYRSAAKFEDLLTISLQVGRLGARSLTTVYHVEVEGRTIAEGKVVAVCCRVHSQHGMAPVEIPARLREKLQPFVVARPDVDGPAGA
ncbi:MAG: 4-hydroxybenzoyl-CoA thioesterase [Pirellulaceae bacterium]|nr:MAG: 4-hydroxybenzoyl-CoA thioesterase [Pirellulaceae bacterium]